MRGPEVTDPLADRLWRPAVWHMRPAITPYRRPTYELTVIGIIMVWNVVANTVVSDTASVPVNAIAVALLLVVARQAGMGLPDLGLRWDSVGRGIRVGAAAMGVVVVAIAALAVVPATREFLADDRFVGVEAAETLYETLVRIPIATALAEEIAFRGVLLGLLVLWTSPLRAVAVSSALFGFWHVWPAIEALETNPATDLASGPLATVAAVIGQVIVTGIAGFGFAWLRLRANNIAAPVLAHWGLNGAAYVAGWLLVAKAWV